ncbi:AI-2E family transporter [Pseudoclavibacter sp. RFBB5]|uniref:AI-2E family transporter n=1 Tax=Pseudoclavibacter sp. RFBB5 TaxID=2080574 RepID=UPI0015E1D228|nr:AI-2E family transporter [Pseudoclavibacter sp. RFBB5]
MWTDQFGRIATRAVQGLVVVTAAALLIWGGREIAIVIIPVLLALIVSSATWPLIKVLTSNGWPRALATVLLLLALIVFLGGALALVVLFVSNQWEELSDQAVQGFNQLVDWANRTFPLTIDQDQINDWIAQAQDFIFSNQFGSVAASGLTTGISSVAAFATSTVLFVVILFFFMKDGPVIWGFLTKAVTGAKRRRVHLMGSRAVHVMGGYVRGTVIVAFVDAVFIGVGLLIIGVPLAFPLAVLVFILAFIPIVGATLAGVIAALVTLVTNGLVPAVVVVGIVVLVNQLEGNFLQPIVLGRSLRLHELVVLIALAVGTVLGNIVGTLLAVPITAVGWALIRAWHEPLEKLQDEALLEDAVLQRLPWLQAGEPRQSDDTTVENL